MSYLQWNSQCFISSSFEVSVFVLTFVWFSATMGFCEINQWPWAVHHSLSFFPSLILSFPMNRQWAERMLALLLSQHASLWQPTEETNTPYRVEGIDGMLVNVCVFLPPIRGIRTPFLFSIFSTVCYLFHNALSQPWVGIFKGKCWGVGVEGDGAVDPRRPPSSPSLVPCTWF